MIKQYFGVKYPFTYKNEENYYIDLNESIDDGLLSDILHVILTPKGQRIRMPNFGTNLIKFIYEPNDSQTWDNINNEVSNSISTFVPNAKLNNIQIIQDENDDNRISLYLDYSVKKGTENENNKVIVNL